MSHPIPKYDVFLSFRGEDTREKFTSHVNAELIRRNIKTFIDNKLERGDEVQSALIEAIEESLIYVVILSKHYASSRWCLDELIKILECKEKYKRKVIPVFYEVDPTDVRHQTGSYGQDFLEHHKDRPKDKIDAWKAALTQVANLSGLESQKFSPENTLVEKIAEVILEKMNRHVSSDYNEGLTGMDKHINQIQPMLQLESPTVRIIGIWGMGGIGKTTIANAIFEKLATQFSSSSKVLNVQEKIEKYGVEHVQKKFLKELLKEDNDITSSNYNFSYQRLKRTKVLLILDDVKDFDQDLIGTHSNFGLGSKIIVTSRNLQVLKNANADEIYKVSEMDDQDSLELFCSFAFKQKQPIESYVSLTEKFLKYADGLPLALKVLGSLLYGKTKEVWESQLQKLEKLPDQDILKSLKLSYDGLDKEQKDIFLDIACFHIGQRKIPLERKLDGCGYSAARIGMEVLKDRCLIFISDQYGCVEMHDLIKEMGQAIVLLEDDPRKRSRLWKTNDIYDVLSKKKGKGTDAIKGISLNMGEIKKIQLDADTFNEMHNLRMIGFHIINYLIDSNSKSNVTCSDDLKFPNNLKYLYWDGFPLRSLPQDSWPEDLISVEMRGSRLEQLWEGDQLEELPEILETMENLKMLNLDETSIKELPSSLHHLVGLQKLSLRSCTKLKTIPSFIGNLSELLELDLTGCASLETFPSSIFKLKLTELDFKGCSMLRTFPEIPNDIGRLSSLTELSLKGSSIVNLPESLAHLSSLKSLDLSDCKLLECVPKLPPNLNQVLAFDCPSIKRMMLNSRSESEKFTFQFDLTNSQELDATSLRNIEEEAYIKINDDAYWSVLFCYPGSAVPDWFSHRCQGHSITIRNDHLNLYRRNRFIGFALCVVLGPDFPYKFSLSHPGFRYELKFESDCQTHFHPNNKLELEYGKQGCYRRFFPHTQDRYRIFAQHHTFLWKYKLDLPRIDVETMTFEIVNDDDDDGGGGGGDSINEEPSIKVKECGIYPLYSKENDDDDDDDNNINEEPSRDAVCLLDLFPSGDAVSSVDPSSSDNYTQNKRRKK